MATRLIRGAGAQATKRWVEKKQIYTYEELEAELAQQEEAERAIAEDEEEDLSDEEQPIYNPKNLPLGWDGKPIPYWLYKVRAPAPTAPPPLL